MITLHDKTFVPYISEATIQEAILTVAGHINHDYAGKQPIFLSILNGAFMFTSDLLKHIAVPCEVSFVKLASYTGTTSSGLVTTLLGLETDITDRDVIILEDIIDTGHTLHSLLPILHSHNPRSIALCTLLYKPAALNQLINILTYPILEIDDTFVVGYGLDYNGLGRNLKTIYKTL